MSLDLWYNSYPCYYDFVRYTNRFRTLSSIKINYLTLKQFGIVIIVSLMHPKTIVMIHTTPDFFNKAVDVRAKYFPNEQHHNDANTPYQKQPIQSSYLIMVV